MTVAETIIQQLGGYGRLRAMIGAYDFVAREDKETGRFIHLTFKFKGSRKANMVTIELDPTDTYNVTFWKFNARTLDLKEVSRHTMIYASNLKTLFEHETGLYLSL